MRFRSVAPWLLVLQACTQKVVPLHELERFAGKVAIRYAEAGRERVLEGELVFDRLSRNFQWVVRGPVTVSLNLLETEATNAFEDGRPRPATAAELAEFAIVRSLARPAKGQEPSVSGSSSGYRARVGAIEYSVTMLETIRGHGQR